MKHADNALRSALLAALFALLGPAMAQAQCSGPANAPDGTLDPCFKTVSGLVWNLQMGIRGSASCVVPLPGGKAMVGGRYLSFDGVRQGGLVRVFEDGRIDTSFRAGTGFDNNVKNVIPLADGKMVVAGWFSSINGTTANNICRLNPNGTLDPSFRTGTGFSSGVHRLLLQPDGKLVAVGGLESYNGRPAGRICRLNPDGTLDNTFQTGSGFDFTALDAGLQPDGKIVVAGYFSTYNGFPIKRLIRLNPDGTRDASFAPPQFNGDVYHVLVLPNGKIALAGDFNQFGQNGTNKLALLNPDGSVDAGFQIGAGPDHNINAMVAQPDGKIMVGGLFSTFNQQASRGIARVNPDGSLDATFQVGTALGSLGGLNALAFQPDGKLLIGGGFNQFNGEPVFDVARLLNQASATASRNSISGAPDFKAHPNPATESLSVFCPEAGVLQLYDSRGALVLEQSVSREEKARLDVACLPKGLYVARLGARTTRVVKE